MQKKHIPKIMLMLSEHVQIEKDRVLFSFTMPNRDGKPSWTSHLLRLHIECAKNRKLFLNYGYTFSESGLLLAFEKCPFKIYIYKSLVHSVTDILTENLLWPA